MSEQNKKPLEVNLKIVTLDDDLKNEAAKSKSLTFTQAEKSEGQKIQLERTKVTPSQPIKPIVKSEVFEGSGPVNFPRPEPQPPSVLVKPVESVSGAFEKSIEPSPPTQEAGELFLTRSDEKLPEVAQIKPSQSVRAEEPAKTVEPIIKEERPIELTKTQRHFNFKLPSFHFPSFWLPSFHLRHGHGFKLKIPSLKFLTKKFIWIPLASAVVLIFVGLILDRAGVFNRILAGNNQLNKSQSKTNVVKPVFVPPNLASSSTSTLKTVASSTPTTTLTVSATTSASTTSIKPVPATSTINISTSSIKTTPPVQSQPAQPVQPTSSTAEPKSPPANQPIPGSQTEITPQGTNAYVPLSLPSIQIPVNALDQNSFAAAWQQALAFQKKEGSLDEINFTYQGEKLPANIVIDYFIQPSFIESKYVQYFKTYFSSNYDIIFYYTYTRKYPILIFDLNNDLGAVPFMRLWDQSTILQDFSNLYLGLPQGSFTRNYLVTQTFTGVNYRIAYQDNDYKFIWTIDNGKLIISSVLIGFEDIIKKLK
ncbi:MAG: hypothetical protein M1505_00730 [Patescibacteria group bacterium]|nr:hypothetical protein [Patescibacteria group bacterium]